MSTVICPRCQTASPATVPEGQPIVCPCCQLTFAAVHNADLMPNPPRRRMGWVIAGVAAAIAVVSLIGYLIAKFGSLLLNAVGAVAGLAIMVGVVSVAVLWIAFPVFSYVYLRQMRDSLRAIESRYLAK